MASINVDLVFLWNAEKEISVVQALEQASPTLRSAE